jgi:UDP-N-acetylglucosamine transferase subunit ALG13
VIFATVGSTQIPFERLVRALEGLPGDRLYAQHGPVPAPAGAMWSQPFMQFPEVLESMRRAEAVVCHAGAGSILCALREGHTPIVVPRLKRYAETVDDHQVEFAEALAAEGSVIAVDDLGRLAEAVASAPPRQAPEQAGILPIQAAVRDALQAPRGRRHGWRIASARG